MLLVHCNFAKGFRGGERQTQLLIETLAKAGWRQKLILRKDSQLTKRCKNIKNLEIIEISKPYILHLDAIKGASLLHAHETKAAQFAYFAHIVTSIPYIITRRVDNPIKNNFLNRKIYADATKVIALSRAIEKEILKVTPNAKTAIIPSAYTNATVDKECVNAIKKRFAKKYLVGNIGALDDKHKGQSYLIEVAKAVAHSHPDIHFLFVGNGQDEAKLKAQAKELQNVTFEGFVENVNDYISSFDLFVFPSNNEGLGSILLDVMQLETPIIASEVGGIVDIIQDKENGLLTPVKDSSAIQEALLELYNNKEKAKRLATNAKKSIHNYSATAMMQHYQKIYNRLKRRK
ncbi:glycosyl transferase, group 1 [hydrothermal vent metagenome]|uniref:Glycosyl transferase, group 1 n=1 Tax=hydrothermal vent metagenome TaxID=652676 RepID=A0A1W1CN87_9ZZZZ